MVYDTMFHPLSFDATNIQNMGFGLKIVDVLNYASVFSSQEH